MNPRRPNCGYGPARPRKSVWTPAAVSAPFIYGVCAKIASRLLSASTTLRTPAFDVRLAGFGLRPADEKGAVNPPPAEATGAEPLPRSLPV